VQIVIRRSQAQCSYFTKSKFMRYVYFLYQKCLYVIAKTLKSVIVFLPSSVMKVGSLLDKFSVGAKTEVARVAMNENHMDTLRHCTCHV